MNITVVGKMQGIKMKQCNSDAKVGKDYLENAKAL